MKSELSPIARSNLAAKVISESTCILVKALVPYKLVKGITGDG